MADQQSTRLTQKQRGGKVFEPRSLMFIPDYRQELRDWLAIAPRKDFDRYPARSRRNSAKNPWRVVAATYYETGWSSPPEKNLVIACMNWSGIEKSPWRVRTAMSQEIGWSSRPDKNAMITWMKWSES
ncbi:hypothetical protein HBH56_112790 [Parastagonospora nodorum]|uniref:Uncharacterized protein n=1 Tax=Phaeosphaeria nodorum (strain SN15 / ATCC MYA-4574 / FGSC 10173) TaxID=321614 RepID=A0A7U2I6F4_PHANO|nr:hypothetical protein HBH56_112790 [Parastagonospora nodorum]QRD03530.1 hypothetical protein JI435_442090 [Parastagonospora nodorum SN15]KAH3925516.1 hypothetical protein HBH54_177570 [Parastagonospora nodorum]KAH3951239.1 hypothetical protein HBH53_068450 [Parastagonospora nodorum]KAH3974177.1 hypothetical protein HBH51_089780 [Parastagonospora nodorum]